MKLRPTTCVLAFLCLLLLTSCSNPQKNTPTPPIRDLAKEHFNLVVNKDFQGFKEIYQGIDKEASNLQELFNQVHALLSLGDIFLPPDSLIWVDTVAIKVENNPQQAILCLIPVSPQKFNPIPEGYFFLYYNQNQELIGYNYNSLRIPHGIPPFTKRDDLVFGDNSIASLSIMYEGGFKHPLLFKRTTYRPIEIERSSQLQLLLNLLSEVELIPVEGIFGHKKFLGNPTMNIVNINLEDGQNFSIFSILESQPNYIEPADKNNRLVVYHYATLNSCYQYQIDKAEHPELVNLIEELSQESIMMTREDRFYLVNPLKQAANQQ